MKKKWIVIPSLLAAIGAFATMPMWRPLLEPMVVVDKAMRVAAVDALVAKLNAHYVFPDKAKQIEAVLRKRQQEGKYDRITDGEQLAKQLTDDIRSVVNDLHMEVAFDNGLVPPDIVMGPPPATLAEWEQQTPFVRRVMVGAYRLVSDLGVEEVEHLSPKIGYLQISEFPPPFFMTEKYGAAMDKLADTDGLIVDVRDNRGGGPDTVSLLTSYFVDQRTRVNDMWDRDTGVSIQRWTEDKLAGKRYGGKKPVVILVGPGTRSAGEDFAYTMQALKRATVIGAPTWGGAHPSRPFRLGDHFAAWIPNRRAINPITLTNWEGVGVKPDIAATPDKALEAAKDLLQRRLQGSAPLVAAGR